jgi:hypothetical protein
MKREDALDNVGRYLMVKSAGLGMAVRHADHPQELSRVRSSCLDGGKRSERTLGGYRCGAVDRAEA